MTVKVGLKEQEILLFLVYGYTFDVLIITGEDLIMVYILEMHSCTIHV